MPLITVITDPAAGGTFLTWSLTWLTGENNYLNVATKAMVPICDNPLTGINAHGFRPNQPITLHDVIETYEYLEQQPGVHFVYFHNLREEIRQWPVDPTIDPAAIALAFKKSNKVIRLQSSTTHDLYHIKWNGRILTTAWNSVNDRYNSFDEQQQDFLNYFFKDSLIMWNQTLGLDSVWDQREFMALNLRPFDQPRMANEPFKGRDYYHLQCQDHWLTLDLVVQDLLHYIELPLDPDRWDHWKQIYEKWKLLHHERMQFVWYFNDIIDCILNGTFLDLRRFDLDLMREAVIQHVLLYKYNLNFKTYNLEKFLDTLQLHQLLESNTCHQLDQIYQSQPNSI